MNEKQSIKDVGVRKKEIALKKKESMDEKVKR